MADLLDELFDPRVPSLTFDVDHLRAVNPAQVRKGLLQLLGTRELPADHVPVAAVLLRPSARKSAEVLRSIWKDPHRPLANRAVAAFVLSSENLDPGATLDTLPALVEAMLFASSAVDDLERAERLLYIVLESSTVDAEAILARVEPMRLWLAASGPSLYGAILRSSAHAVCHERILAVLERDRLTDAVVRSAAAGGALSAALAEAFLARAPGPKQQATGRAFVGPRCGQCHGFDVVLLADLSTLEGVRPVAASLHLSATESSRGKFVPLPCAGTQAELLEQMLRSHHVEVPVSAIAASVDTAYSADENDEGTERLLWFLRQLAPGEATIEDVLEANRAAMVERMRQTATEIRTIETQDDPRLEEATSIVLPALMEGLYSADESSVDPFSTVELLDATLDAVERTSFRWGVWPSLVHQVWPALASLLEQDDVRDDVVQLLPLSRQRRLNWQTTLAYAARCSGSDNARNRALLDVWVHGAQTSLIELGVTPRKVLEALGGPPEALLTVAEWFDVGPDDLIQSADSF